MKKLLLLLFFVPIWAFSQTAEDIRPTIAVPVVKSSHERHQKYLFAITSKVTEVLKNSKRFNVVSRSDEDVKAERKFQKSDEFLDRTLNAQNASETQDIAGDELNVKRITSEVKDDGTVVFYGANYILQGEVRKLDIVKILNADNSTAGYKALLSIQLAVNTTETNTLTEAIGIESVPLSVAMMSVERAVDEAIKSLEASLASYFYRTFPLTCTINKTEGNDVIINAGLAQGVKVGDKFKVVSVEDMGSEKIEILVGEIKVKNVASQNFAQCSMVKGKAEIVKKFAMASKLKCILIL